MTTSAFVTSRVDLDRSLGSATAGDVVLIAQQSLRIGVPLTAIAICEAAHGLGLRDPAITLCEATARFVAGEQARALVMIEEVLDAIPEHLVALNLKAQMLIPLSRHAESLSILRRLADSFPDFPGAQGAISSLLLPGRQYREVLARIHAVLSPDTYLEVGVATGATLALATTASIAVGVDPADDPLLYPLLPTARLYRVESDTFFAQQSKATVFSGRAVDLTFIDGMHLFEYAVRDFVNAERWAAQSGTIVLHDCLPPTRIAACRERVSTFWTGDVWKVLEILLDHRPDLQIRVVPSAPSGLVIVRGLDPQSTVLADKMAEILESFQGREYSHIPGEWPERYRLVSNDDEGLARALQ